MIDIDSRVKEIVHRLRDGGHKVTPQRLAVIRTLVRNPEHPSVEDIFNILLHDFPGISRATVYRTIMLVKSIGEVLELGFPDGGNRYDGNKPWPHPHVVCLRCGKIMDAHLSGLDEMIAETVQKTGFDISAYRLDFFGICPECGARGKG